MMVRTFPALAVLLAAAVVWAEPPARTDNPSATLPPHHIIKLTVRVEPVQPPALKYRLLPDPADLVPGNAAPFWLRAGRAAAQVKHKWTEAEEKWLSAEWTALKDLPRKEVEQLLAEYRPALRLAEDAACRDHCDWELGPITIQTIDYLPLDEIQSVREIANRLSLRARLEMAEGQPDKSLHTIQVGMALARDVGSGPTMINSLVGYAVASIMLGRVEELIQEPGAPNLYWALTELPRPFTDLRKTMQYEFATFYRSFPQLREVEKGDLSAKQSEALFSELVKTLTTFPVKDGRPKWAENLTAAAALTATLPTAKRYLVAHGRTAEQVDAMPATRAVLLYIVDQYNRDRDDVLKWFNLPPWQTRLGLQEVQKRLKAEGPAVAGSSVIDGKWVMMQLLAPAMLKTFEAELRVDRQIAGLRCAEAVRLHAAAHDGKLPKALADVTDVPLPIDPVTGKGFDEFYKATGDTAVLEVPPPPGQPPQLGYHYELTPAR
jgi:hypothetical protein